MIHIDRLNSMMRQAVSLARKSAKQGCDPFGAVIAKGGRVVVSGHNLAAKDRNPLLHAEISVIRKAASSLHTSSLRGYVLITSCAPCVRCQVAAYQAQISHIIYASTRQEAAETGFDDQTLRLGIMAFKEQRYGELEVPVRRLSTKELVEQFRVWHLQTYHGKVAFDENITAVVTRPDGTIVAAGKNEIDTNNPIGHGGVRAIEQACQARGTIQLTDHTLAMLCSCPQCVGNALNVHPDEIIVGYEDETAPKNSDALYAVALSRDLQNHPNMPTSTRIESPDILAAARDVFKAWRYGLLSPSTR